MFTLTRLFAAVASLAQNVEALAGSIGEANANFRQRLSLDGPPALAHQPAQDGPEVAETAAVSPERPRGRRKAV